MIKSRRNIIRTQYCIHVKLPIRALSEKSVAAPSSLYIGDANPTTKPACFPRQRRNSPVFSIARTLYIYGGGVGETSAASGEKQKLGQGLCDFAHEIVSHGSFTRVREHTDTGVLRRNIIAKAAFDEIDTNKRST